MAKNKDPAVLFYTADFLADTTLWNYDELGRYIKLLCIQHLQGGIAEDDFLAVTEASSRVASKFDLCDDGMYRNKRMREETEKREAYKDKLRANGALGGRSKAKAKLEQSLSDAKAEPKQSSSTRVENENININVIKDIIDYLNSKLNTKYQYTADYIQRHINARLSEGYGFEDFKTVIDKKYREWSGTEFAKFLRPETLFGTKFVQYLNQLEATERSKEMATPQPIIHEAKYNTFDPEEALERALQRTYHEE